MISPSIKLTKMSSIMKFLSTYLGRPQKITLQGVKMTLAGFCRTLISWVI